MRLSLFLLIFNAANSLFAQTVVPKVVVGTTEIQLFDQGKYIYIQALPHQAFRITYRENPFSEFSFSLAYAPEIKPIPNAFEVKDGPFLVTMKRDEVVLKYDFAQHRLTASNKGNVIFEEYLGFTKEADTIGFSILLKEEEAIYGMGSRSISENRRGAAFYLNNKAQYGYDLNASTLNYNVPFYVSSRGYSLFFENTGLAKMDVGASDTNSLTYKFRTGNTGYCLILGETALNQVANFYKLTGTQPLPPLWSFGFIQSRFGYESEEQVWRAVKGLKKSHYPVDAVVLDLYWFGQPDRIGDLAWDTVNFPNPKKMISDLRNNGVKTVAITETYFTKNSKQYPVADRLGYLAKDSTGKTYSFDKFWADTAALLDVYNTDATNWFWKFYEPLKEDGIAGWWCDLGEPELHPLDAVHIKGSVEELHNLYNFYWAKLLFDKQNEHYPKERLFNLARSGWTGSQRLGVLPWSGDVNRHWKGFQAQMPIMLGSSISGLPYMHADAGGFAMGKYDPELYTRWLQFAAFTPIMRAHGGGSMVPSEPFYYGEPYNSIVRSFVEKRYQMLPYTYTLAAEQSLFGNPMIYPQQFLYPGLEASNTQFFWGKQLLIAPVLTPNTTTKKVDLPAGVWYNLSTEEPFRGPQEIEVEAPLHEVPTFVKAGSFMPSAPLMSNTDLYKSDSLSFDYWFDPNLNASSEYKMYYDDGANPSSVSGRFYQFIVLNAENNNNGELKISIKLDGDISIGPSSRRITLKIKSASVKGYQVFKTQGKLPLQEFVAQSRENEFEISFNWYGESLDFFFKDPILFDYSPRKSLLAIYDTQTETYQIEHQEVGAGKIIVYNSLGNSIYETTFHNYFPGKNTVTLPREITQKIKKLPGVYSVLMNGGSGRFRILVNGKE